MKIRLLALLLCLPILSAFLFGCGKTEPPAATARPVKEDEIEKDHGIPVIVNDCVSPLEGEEPLALTGIENVLRIAYVLQHAENYTLEGRGTVKTKVAFISYSQDVEVYKDYRLGVLLEIDITKSALKNDAWQTCYVENTALIRGAADGKNAWDGRNTEWTDGDPEVFTREEYRKKYGLFGFELSNYILNADTVDAWTDTVDNGDGTYTLTVFPNVTAATGDAIRRMKTMGGLDKDPVFKEAAITVTFDRSWRVLSMHLDENYSVKLGIINSDDCRAETDYVFTYGNADVSDFPAYFAWYVK